MWKVWKGEEVEHKRRWPLAHALSPRVCVCERWERSGGEIFPRRSAVLAKENARRTSHKGSSSIFISMPCEKEEGKVWTIHTICVWVHHTTYISKSHLTHSFRPLDGQFQYLAKTSNPDRSHKARTASESMVNYGRGTKMSSRVPDSAGIHM